MVSGFVTSPDDQSRICLLDARPMRIASKSLISIKFSASPSLFCVSQLDFAELLDLLFRSSVARDLDVLEIAKCLVGRQRQLTRLVGPLLAFLDLLPRRLARRGAKRAWRQVDAELLGRPQELVVLLAHLDCTPLVRE